MKTKIKLEKNDLAIVVKPNGSSEIFLPWDKKDKDGGDISYKAIDTMLREIRQLELAFTELKNMTMEENT